MKTLLSILLIIFISGIQVLAQTQTSKPATPSTFKPTQKYGFKVGANLSTILGFAGGQVQVGGHGGFTVNVRESKSLGYGIDMLFSHQGVRAHQGTILMNYIQLPLFLNMYTGPVCFQGGGYAALLLNAFNARSPGDISSNFQGLDYGVLAGVTFNPEGKVFVNTRINFGLAGMTQQEEGHNLNFQTSVGLNF